MFEPSAKNAYKTVKAPESLKKRVEEMACEACDKAARQNPPKETVRSLWQKKLLIKKRLKRRKRHLIKSGRIQPWQFQRMML